uniref:Fic family protein n=1 Tax=Desulfatirhabdium butyrativorans TaxID=340467 RepID=A0A7C4MRH5_9BACT
MKVCLTRCVGLRKWLERRHRIVKESGGSLQIQNFGALKSAFQQPGLTFRGDDLYARLAKKAADLAFSIMRNHPFIDGNRHPRNLCTTAAPSPGIEWGPSWFKTIQDFRLASFPKRT